MAKLSLQFHADPSEVFNWVVVWAHEMDLFLAVEAFAPEYRVEALDRAQVGQGLEAFGAVSRVSLSVVTIDTGATSALDFLRRNPAILVVSIGANSDGVLRESTIAAMTDDAPSLATWKAIRSKAKALMQTGTVCVLNPASGVRQSVKSHYYSHGAQELARRGVRMLAAAGWNEFDFDG